MKRGPDWNYDDEDGGPGNFGTIVDNCEIGSEFNVVVKWDVTGNEEEYCCGSQNKYDLELVDVW